MDPLKANKKIVIRLSRVSLLVARQGRGNPRKIVGVRSYSLGIERVLVVWWLGKEVSSWGGGRARGVGPWEESARGW